MKNIYIVSHKDDFYGLYVAAKTRGQAKAYVADDEGNPFAEYRARLVVKNAEFDGTGYLTQKELQRLGLAVSGYYDENGNWVEVEE